MEQGVLQKTGKPGLDRWRKSQAARGGLGRWRFILHQWTQWRVVSKTEPRVQQGHAFYIFTTKLKGESAPRNCCRRGYQVTIGVFRVLVIFQSIFVKVTQILYYKRMGKQGWPIKGYLALAIPKLLEWTEERLFKESGGMLLPFVLFFPRAEFAGPQLHTFLLVVNLLQYTKSHFSYII